MSNNAKSTERKHASESYIITFYREVELLTHTYALYKNVLRELKSKYDGSDEGYSALEDNEKLIISQYLAQLRSSLEKSYIQFKTLNKQIQYSDSENLEEYYLQLDTQHMLREKDLQKYILELNLFLASEIMQEFLQNITTDVNSLYE